MRTIHRDDLHDIDRRLDRDLEREGDYRSPRRRLPLTGEGFLARKFGPPSGERGGRS